MKILSISVKILPASSLDEGSNCGGTQRVRVRFSEFERFGTEVSSESSTVGDDSEVDSFSGRIISSSFDTGVAVCFTAGIIVAVGVPANIFFTSEQPEIIRITNKADTKTAAPKRIGCFLKKCILAICSLIYFTPARIILL